MVVLDVKGAAEFLGVSPKTASALMRRLPHGDASRSEGPNKLLVIAKETLERFVLGEIEPEPIGREPVSVPLPKAKRKPPKHTQLVDGKIPLRSYK